MTATDHTRRRNKKAADALRESARRLRNDLDRLADAIEDGEVTEELVFQTIRALTYTHIDIEDAAEDADAIDCRTRPWQTIDQTRQAMYHATRGDTSNAILSATAAAEFAELDRDDRK